jgi:hypothetical protein
LLTFAEVSWRSLNIARSTCSAVDAPSHSFRPLVILHRGVILSGMQVTRRHNGPNCLTTRSAVSNRSRLLDGVDGRTASARRYRDLCRAFEEELGGSLTEVELGLVKQAATLIRR